MEISTISSVLMLIAGIGVFLVACSTLSSNIEAVGSRQMKSVFAKVSDRKLVGVGIGTSVTAAIQSSAATIVLVIGFVNAGVMGLSLAAPIIYGANIGTTITAWIASLSAVDAQSLSLMVVFSALVGIGSFIKLFAKKDSIRSIGGILIGFGLIFVALEMMKNAMSGFVQSDSIRDVISSVTNIFLLILIGFGITALTQSSSVTTAVLIAMLPSAAMTGLIDLQQAIYITIGANVGSCVIVLISGFTGSVNAKRAALIHLIFNVTGMIVFVVAEFVLKAFDPAGGFASIFSKVFTSVPAMQLATFHTTFKVVTTLIMLPLTGLLIKFINRVIPEPKADDSNKTHLYYMNTYMLRNPPVAVQQLKKEVINMASIAEANFRYSVKMIRDLDFDDLETFEWNEKELDFLNKEIARYLVKISKTRLSATDRLYVSSVYHTITDLERIGDYAVNIVEYAQRLVAIEGRFSETAIAEVDHMEEKVSELYKKVIEAYQKNSLDVYEEAFLIEEEIDVITRQMSDNHIKRLNAGICALDVGAEYLSLASDTERIADHFMNVGKTIKESS